MRCFYPVIVISLGLLTVAAGCRRGETTRTTVGPGTAAVAGVYNKDAIHAEALLKKANVPYVLRYDLAQKQLPAGCTWHAAYATQNPEVVLEVFAFGGEADARACMTERYNAFDGLQPPRAHMAVANATLLLIAHYDPRDRGQAKYETMSKFIAAFKM